MALCAMSQAKRARGVDSEASAAHCILSVVLALCGLSFEVDTAPRHSAVEQRRVCACWTLAARIEWKGSFTEGMRIRNRAKIGQRTIRLAVDGR